ncbi:GNAT family acetyltransferase [Novosphingobium olei]|uniref:GNAT family acetyltransferase n=1 Tax=Novosphingobium olei TaxID=2728851 RepID=UPI00308AAF90|nr:GNAT family acetyltransferase [Novosphingobium olei]
MTIRTALPADEAATVALWQAAGLTRPWNDANADFRLALANETSDVLLAETDRALAGAVMVGFDGHRGWVYYLGVDPAQRRAGIGAALMAAAEQWLKARGCPKIMFMVRHDNIATKAFYAALGYEENAVVTMGRRLDDD